MTSMAHWKREWRRRVLNFTPSWFSVNMGTGICSILLYNLPYQFRGLDVIAIVVFVLNVILFTTFLTLSILRYTIWPSVFGKMINHPVQSLFLGTFPMGFATIVNMVVFACVAPWGGKWITFAWALWWIDSIISIIIAFGVPFFMFTKHEHSLAGVTGVWLQPLVAPIVAAATGGIIAQYLPPSHAKLTITLSYMLWGAGFFPALLIMSIYFQRLAMHKCPPNVLIVSTFLPLGPCGQGSFALLRLSTVIRNLTQDASATSLYTAEEIRMFGSAIYAGTIPLAFAIWGFGLFWLVIAVTSVLHLGTKERLKFNMGWWAFTFPLGVFTGATTQLANELNSEAFRVLGMIFSLLVVALWVYISIMTMTQAWTGVMFFAPCLGDEEAGLLAGKHQDKLPGAPGDNVELEVDV